MKMTVFPRYLLAIVMSLMTMAAAAAPGVMVLGTPHFAMPGQDLINPDVGDVRTEHAEDIEASVDALARWKPTRIAIGRTTQGMEREQQNYRDYLDGTFELTPDEAHQIGFRLARRLGHDRLYGIDFHKEMDVGAVMEYASASGQGELMEAAMNRIH